MSRAGLLCLVLTALVVPHDTTAQSVQGFKDGNELLRICTSRLPFESGICLGYLQGIADQMEAMRSANKARPCLPAGVVGQQLTDVVVKYLQQNPVMRTEPGAHLATIAIGDAWGCGSSK